MNGYEPKGFDEDAFGDKGNQSGLKTFDAFRKLTFIHIVSYREHNTAQEPQTL